MVRRSHKMAVDELGLVARKTAAELELQELTLEHERLLREIGKNQQRLLLARGVRSELQARFALQLEPIQRQVRNLVQESGGLFERLLNPECSLSRRQKANVRRVQTAFEREFAVGESRADVAAQDAHEARINPNAAQSAPKPDAERAATLHATFRRLVNAVHPDKVQAQAAKDERTELLKDITRAYETGDLARLVHLEDALLAKAPVPRDTAFVERRVKELLASNAELRRQLKVLTRELRAVKRAWPESPQGPDAVAASDWITTHVEECQRQLQRLTVTLDLLRELCAGKLSALAFLDASFCDASETPERRDGSRNLRTKLSGVSEVNEANVDAVLEAFKQQLEKLRTR